MVAAFVTLSWPKTRKCDKLAHPWGGQFQCLGRPFSGVAGLPLSECVCRPVVLRPEGRGVEFALTTFSVLVEGFGVTFRGVGTGVASSTTTGAGGCAERLYKWYAATPHTMMITIRRKFFMKTVPSLARRAVERKLRTVWRGSRLPLCCGT